MTDTPQPQPEPMREKLEKVIYEITDEAYDAGQRHLIIEQNGVSLDALEAIVAEARVSSYKQGYIDGSIEQLNQETKS